MFDTGLAHEHQRLAEEAGFSSAELRELILRAVQSTWLPEERRRHLSSAFTRSPAWSAEPDM
jgi:adenosine deaminase